MRMHGRNQGLKLKQADRAALEALTRRGRESVRVLRRARVLQLVSEGWTVVGAAEAVGVTQTTVRTVRRRYQEEGLGQRCMMLLSTVVEGYRPDFRPTR